MRLHVNQVAFRGNSSLPSNIKELQTPMQIFQYFFTKDIVTSIVEETNRAAHIEDINTKFNARLCVDEQMCSTKLKHHLRQYMPNKPHKWGIKLKCFYKFTIIFYVYSQIHQILEVHQML